MNQFRPECQGVDPIDVYDHLTQAREIINWMEALAGAISDASDNKYRVKRLSGLLHYLATDWSAHFDTAAEEIAKQNGMEHTP